MQIKSILAGTALVLGLVVVLPPAVSAQGTELGASIAAIGVTTGGGSTVTQAMVGGSAFSVGFFLSPGVALEPSFQLLYVSSEGDSFTTLGLGLALPIYFDKSWGHSGMYIAPQVGISYVNSNGSATQLNVGADLGNKVRLSDNASFRFGVGVNHGLENDDFGSATTVQGFFGFSVFLKK